MELYVAYLMLLNSFCLCFQDHGSHLKSTGVFQDEELLFSHTQQRDNDPDVDLFATSPKPAVSF